ncbi:tRNA 5-methylaminomethyl-2-thiouridine biosynthesis bifunctional protein MnmC [Burkholderiales bacterium GJ-E10]|nr:tRNA 5-methylaminomethyl-2-thiouridine biosynthesis bifunctional protein MnmC [Burkholderiales bacterium GJ-E10]
MTIGISPEPLQFDEHGNPVSLRYGDIYASRDGAAAQARHVFLGGNDLPVRWARRRQFVIVETGFGLGTNFLAAWQAWREDPQRPQRLHFVSVERHPVRAQDLAGLPAADSLHALRAQLAACWPLPLAGVHRIEFEAGRVVLTLGLGDAADLLPDLVVGADAFFLDGFAPARNPEMWQPEIIRALARMARPDATLATYTCARAVRDALAQEGFAVDLRPGFGSKREMVAARYAPGWKRRRIEPPAPHDGERSAIVVGAGLAGAATAHALARRGWTVRLLERGADVADGASGLPAGLLHPALSVDHNLASRLSQAGFLLARSWLDALAVDGGDPVWSACGVFQQGQAELDGEGESALRDLLARAALPPDYARWVEPTAAAALCGLAPRRGGIWFGTGGVVSARRWCRAMLAGDPGGAGGRIDLGTGRDIERIERADGAWRVTAADGASWAAPILVLANALGASALAGARFAPLRAVRGQVSLFDPPALAGLRAGICGDGYLIPAGLGRAAVGASYEESERLGEAEAHRENRARWAAALNGPSPAEPAGVFAGERCVSADRLPLAGPIADEETVLADAARMAGARLAELPRRPGLWTVSGLGSRGLTLACLGAELVASRIEGEPWPVERAPADAIDPARFLLRHIRRGGLRGIPENGQG